MGNSESSTVKPVNQDTHPTLSIPPPVMGYNNPPGGYVVNPYNSPVYPIQYTSDPYVFYPPSHSYPPLYVEYIIPEQQNPPRRRHRHHRSSQHQRHRSHSPPQPERLSRPFREELAIMSQPLSRESPVQTKPLVSPVVITKVSPPATTKQSIYQPPPPPVKNPLSTKNITIAAPLTVSNDQQPVPLIKLHGFEKAPRLATNHISKSVDNISVHKDGSDLLTVVPESSFSYSKSTNRWYDHDYDRRVKRLVIDDL